MANVIGYEIKYLNEHGELINAFEESAEKVIQILEEADQSIDKRVDVRTVFSDRSKSYGFSNRTRIW